MFDSLSFRVGSSNREHVIVRPSRREHPEPEYYDDANWIDATIEIAAGAFQGTFAAMLRAEDFVRFRNELRPLYESLAGKATFDTMEGWLRIDVQGDGKGHFHAACEAIDQLGWGSRLTFKIEFDHRGNRTFRHTASVRVGRLDLRPRRDGAYVGPLR